MTEELTANPRGSVWHRWDPHLHAPGTLLNDQFHGDWAAYFARIENSQPLVRALGVTDYFCIQTYREVRRRKREEQRLSAVDLLFPNVELRLDLKTATQKGINIHLLFSPDDPKHEAEIERILSKLIFPTERTEYHCHLADLVRLGQDFDPSQTNPEAAIRTGANQFKTTLKDLRNLFKTEKWMRENCLVAVASKSGDGTSGLQEDDSFKATRREVEGFADIIFGSNPKQRAFWLGQTQHGGREFIEKTYRGLKPCLHGSDAHEEQSVTAPDGGRLCWIKGDVTFETLRQAVIEPADRVSIGPRPPTLENASEAIVRVETSAAPWLAKSSINVNPGFVAIVGARGSGKTALADIIAAGAGARIVQAPPERWPESVAVHASFLKRASDPEDHLGSASVTLTWGDGTTSGDQLNPSLANQEHPVLARYLSQHFVESLCSTAGLASDLRREIERVVFESIDPTQRLEANSFEELAEAHLAPIRSRRSELRGLIRRIADAIVHEEERRDRLPAQRREVEATKRQIEVDMKALADLLPKDKTTHISKLALLESACTAATGRVEALRRRRKTIGDLTAETRNIETFYEPTRHAEMKRRFAAAGLSGTTWANFLMRFAGDVSSATLQATRETDAAIHLATEGSSTWQPPRDQSPSAEWPLSRLTALRNEARVAVGIDTEGQKKYEERRKMLAQRELLLQRLEGEIKEAEGADQRRKDLIGNRRDTYRQVVATLVEEEEVLKRLYAPTREQIEGGTGALSKLAFSVLRQVNLDRWCSAGESLIDLRNATRFRGRGALREQVEKYLVSAWRTADADAIATAMDQFRAEVSHELLAAMPASLSGTEKRAWQQQLAQWLYDTAHITVHYGISYEGVAIEHLSPGTRGIVLLLLYLAIDRNDTRPLIIDQPEENLDPNSVFTELVPHFREARKRRQIVVVTHNANLVVNTDADQVIVARAARQSGMALPVISYQSGALENKAIRAAVCDLLEGGERAFLERERRYRLKWGESLALEPISGGDEQA